MNKIYKKITDYLINNQLALAQLFKLLSTEVDQQKLLFTSAGFNSSQDQNIDFALKRNNLLTMVKEICSARTSSLTNKTEMVYFLFSILQKTDSVQEVLSFNFYKNEDQNTLNVSEDTYKSESSCISNHKTLFQVNKKSNRKSKYKGVSKNGNKWQVLIMLEGKRKYVGSYQTEDEAARAYDMYYLKNIGNKRKLNFTYSSEEIDSIQKY